MPVELFQEALTNEIVIAVIYSVAILFGAACIGVGLGRHR